MRERQNINRTKKDTRGRQVSIEVRKILRMRCWSEVGGGKEVEAEIAETYFVHLLLQVV